MEQQAHGVSTHEIGQLELQPQSVPETGAPPAGEQARVQAPAEGARMADLEAALGRAREALDHAERRHAIDLELLRAGVVDMEVARLMTELAVAGMDKADVAHAVADLRRRKPFLFRRQSLPGLMAPLTDAGGGEREALAREAAESGDRRALLRYLRARRAS
ncbi:MAG: hypothetical protein DYG92_14615 [Leptolyngbya sp. PLA1]|nr:hypothetical protein [Leptolyngbya sp. PLA1]